MSFNTGLTEKFIRHCNRLLRSSINFFSTEQTEVFAACTKNPQMLSCASMKTHFLSLPPIWRHLKMFFSSTFPYRELGLVCHWQGRAGVRGSVEPPLRSMLLEQTVSQGSRAHKHPPQCDPAISPKSQDVSSPWRSWWGETWGCRQVPRARPAEAQLQTPRLCWLPQYHEGWQPFDIFANSDESF